MTVRPPSGLAVARRVSPVNEGLPVPEANCDGPWELGRAASAGKTRRLEIWLRVSWWRAKRRLEDAALHPATWLTLGVIWLAVVAYLQLKSGRAL